MQHLNILARLKGKDDIEKESSESDLIDIETFVLHQRISKQGFGNCSCLPTLRPVLEPPKSDNADLSAKSLIPAVLAMETLEREFLSGCYLCFLPSRPRAGFGAQAKGRVRSARPDAKPLNGAATVVGGQDFPTDWGRCSCLLGYGWTARRRSGGSESSDCGR